MAAFSFGFDDASATATLSEHNVELRAACELFASDFVEEDEAKFVAWPVESVAVGEVSLKKRVPPEAAVPDLLHGERSGEADKSDDGRALAAKRSDAHTSHGRLAPFAPSSLRFSLLLCES